MKLRAFIYENAGVWRRPEFKSSYRYAAESASDIPPEDENPASEMLDIQI